VTEPVRLLTLDTVAERLAVSRRTVQRLIDAGELRAVRFGRTRHSWCAERVRRSAFEVTTGHAARIVWRDSVLGSCPPRR